MSADDNENAGGNNVLDPQTGLPRVLSRRCETCIFWTDGRALVSRERRDELAQAAVENDSWVICHSTLPNRVPAGEQAICRGFWGKHKNDTLGCRLATMLGGPVKVEPPTS